MTSVRYVIRRMLRSPGFTFLVLATIVLSIGINFGILSVTQAIFFRTLSVPDAGELLRYSIGSGEIRYLFSGPSYDSLRSIGVLENQFAWKSEIFRMRDENGMSYVSGALLTGNGFSTLRLSPALGHFFNEQQDRPGGGSDGWEGVIGFDLWKNRFSGDFRVLGRTVFVNGAPVKIVGILPKEFRGMSPLDTANILLPRHFQEVISPREDRFANPGYMEWLVFGRLPNGISIKSVQANLHAIDSRFRHLADPSGELFAEAYGADTGSSLLRVENGRLGARSSLFSLQKPVLVINVLGGGVFFFCTCNLILLFIVRTGRESKATAVRLALGARTSHGVRLAILEALVLATLGFTIGVPVAWAAARILSRAFQSMIGMETFPTVTPDIPFLIWAFLIMLIAGACSAGFTSLWNSGERWSVNLKGGNIVRSSGFGGWIIGLEVIITLLLITASAVSGSGVFRLANQSSGFGLGDAVLATLDLEDGRPAASSSSGELKRILEIVKHYPGVQSVATTNLLPINGSDGKGLFTVRSEDGLVRHLIMWPARVSVDYFPTIGTKITYGRGFETTDAEGDSVCVLSLNSASKLFPEGNPLGKYLYRGEAPKTEADAPYCRVVGIAENAHLKSMSEKSDLAVYSVAKAPLPNLIVKASTSAVAIQAMKTAVQSVSPDSLLPGMSTVSSHIEDDLRLVRVMTFCGVLCAYLAATIFAIGFFGVLSLRVSERRRDIGVQIALGADRMQVCMSVLKGLRTPVSVGLAFGSVAAVFAAFKLAELLQMRTDIAIAGYFIGVVILVLLSLASAALPLRSAVNVSPMECLRNE